MTSQPHEGCDTVLKTLYRLGDRCQSKATCWIKMPCKLIWHQLSHCAHSHFEWERKLTSEHGRNVQSARKEPWEELRLKRGKSLSGWLSVVSQIWTPVTCICVNHKVKLTSCCQTTFNLLLLTQFRRNSELQCHASELWAAYWIGINLTPCTCELEHQRRLL